MPLSSSLGVHSAFENATHSTVGNIPSITKLFLQILTHCCDVELLLQACILFNEYTVSLVH